GQFGIFRGRASQRVVIDFEARVVEYVRTRLVHPSQVLRNLPGGGVRLTMTIGDITEVATWVLGFGDTAHVIEPEQLAERVRGELQRALARYDDLKASPTSTSKATSASTEAP